MSIKPILNKVLIEIEKEQEKTSSGLYLPENKKHDHFGWAKVLATGSKVKEVKTGDRIYLNRALLRREVDPMTFIIEEDAILCKET